MSSTPRSSRAASAALIVSCASFLSSLSWRPLSAQAATECCEFLYPPGFTAISVLRNEDGGPPQTHTGTAYITAGPSSGATVPISHANFFFAPAGTFISHICIALKCPTTPFTCAPGSCGDPAEIRISLPHADGYPGGAAIYSQLFTIDPVCNSLGTRSYQLVPLTSRLPVGGAFWVEVHYPTAQSPVTSGLGHQGIRQRTPGARSAIHIPPTRPAFRDWWDYDDVVFRGSGISYAPIIRALDLVSAPATCSITVNPSSGLVTTEPGGPALFDVTITGIPTSSVTIELASSDPSEGLLKLAGGPMTPSTPFGLFFDPALWVPGQTSETQTVEVVGQDDVIVDGNVAYQVNMTVLTSDPCYQTAAVTTVSLTNLDDDVASPGTIPTVPVVDPGNPADVTGFGSVGYDFEIGLTEVTNAQYTAFLNAVATSSDPNRLYNPFMASECRGGITCVRITRSSCSYGVKPDFADKPVNFVSWLDAARFANWLHNGRPTGPQGPATTEDGAYDLRTPNPGLTAVRKAGARWFLPSEDEWYKAAYYDPADPAADAGGTPDYWLYPTRSDATPLPALATASGAVANPGPNVANYFNQFLWSCPGTLSSVSECGGCGPASASYYGTFDQGGNVFEWTETRRAGSSGLVMRGGDMGNAANTLEATSASGNLPDREDSIIGFRVATRAGAVAVPTFRRGDANDDGGIDLSDAIFVLRFLFSGGGTAPSCPDAADANDDGSPDLGDPIFLLNYQFRGGAAPPSPGPMNCGPDPTPDSLGPCVSAHCP
jgi:formylglycine-generating enzyme required for sulfatase activity